jgi:hypothetical protein
MKYPSRKEQDWKANEAEFAAAKEQGLQQIYHAYPVIPRSDANDAGIEELCANFYGNGTLGYPAPDLPTFRSIIEAEPDILTGKHGRLIIEPVERQKIRAIAEVEVLLSRWHPHDLKTELTKLRFQSLEQVQARRQQIIEERRLRKMSATAIKGELQAGRPVPKAQILPVEITKETIHAMPSGQIRELIRKYGASTVNNRLFGRS